MWKKITALWPSGRIWKKMMLALVMFAIGILAFCWGRRGALSEAKATPPDVPMVHDGGIHASASSGDYGKRVVATLYNNVPITREDLGEYLIARFGAQRVEFLVNRRIIEMECQARGIVVTDAEIRAQLDLDLRSFGPTAMSEKDFSNQVLRRFNKTIYEWKEDVIRPKLMLSKLARPRVVVTEDDLKSAFEAKYGEKVECRMIVLQTDNPHKHDIWALVSKDKNAFDDEAKKQFIPALASQGGKVPPIHKHFANDTIRKEAFRLRVGEVSQLLEMPDKTLIILRCEGRIPPDTTKVMEAERLALVRDVNEIKLQEEIPKLFQELRQRANPTLYLRDQVREEELVRAAQKELGIAPGNGIRSEPPPQK